MNKKKCPVCKSSHTIKYGVRKGVQLYRCSDCGYQFRAVREVSKDELWRVYQQEKQTIRELPERFGMSVATVKRRLHDIKREWVNPPLGGSGFLRLDTTYRGRGFGVLLALDNATGSPLYIAFVKSETVKDYEDAVESVKERGYTIDGIIIDGKQTLFKTFAGHPVQMCQFHMKQIIRRYLTKNPKLLAASNITNVYKLFKGRLVTNFDDRSFNPFFLFSFSLRKRGKNLKSPSRFCNLFYYCPLNTTYPCPTSLLPVVWHTYLL